MTDRVSVIVCTYKHDTGILLQSIESVLVQDYNDIELIVADDGTDNFEAQKCIDYINERSKGNISKVTVYTNGNNVGTVASINKALKLTTGDYIRVIAGDDAYSDPTVFSAQISRLKDDEHLFGVIGQIQQCDWDLCPIDDDRIRRSNGYMPEMFGQEPDDIKKKIFKENLFPISIQTACFRRTFFEETGMLEEKYRVVDDLPLVQHIIDNIKRFCYVDQAVVMHRVGNGISTTKEYFSARKSAYYKDMYVFAKDVWCSDIKIYGRIRPVLMAETYRKSYQAVRLSNDRKSSAMLLKMQILLMRLAVRPGETLMKLYSILKDRLHIGVIV